MRVAYLGPSGTFTEEALLAHEWALGGSGDGLDRVPYPSIYEAVMAVQEGTADRAVVPIENSLEGAVTATLDALSGDAPNVRIGAEFVHPISHCLIARQPMDLDQVERVVSHPQATAQCARFLRERLRQAERVSAASTAEAVRMVAAGDERWAALGSRLAAELYGCPVLEAGVEDRPDNETRFVALTPAEALPPAEPSKTSIVFWGFDDASPGALVDVLRELSDRGVNLTKIESRPRRVRLGHYMFFADLEGGGEAGPVREALDALARRVESLRILGSYPAVPPPSGDPETASGRADRGARE